VRRPWALPLVPLYWAGLRVKNAFFSWGWLRVRRLERPVISVGSLSAGGAGKTPVVLMLAELLGRHGVEVDVLSRGYGRGSGVVEEVDAAGLASRFGDEPLEMARRGVRVVVGADRWAAGRLVEGSNEDGRAVGSIPHPFDETERMGHPVHLLDDGFQHRRLHRDLDVVLLTVEDVRDWLLPAGNLREPMGSLGQADVVVVREDEAVELRTAIPVGAEVWTVRRELALPVERPKKPVVFCGIARPEGFLTMLRGAGCEAAEWVVFPDHYAYAESDFAQLVEAARHAGADGFCTTAKDAVKIPEASMRMLEAVGPVVVAALRVSLVDEGQAWTAISRACGFGVIGQ